MKTFKQIREDTVPATSVSGGGIAGINPNEVPPVGKGITTAGRMLRRSKVNITGRKK